jgi:hypothetical protein
VDTSSTLVPAEKQAVAGLFIVYLPVMPCARHTPLMTCPEVTFRLKATPLPRTGAWLHWTAHFSVPLACQAPWLKAIGIEWSHGAKSALALVRMMVQGVPVQAIVMSIGPRTQPWLLLPVMEQFSSLRYSTHLPVMAESRLANSRQQRPVSRDEPHLIRAELPLQDKELVAQRKDLRVFLLTARRQ